LEIDGASNRGVDNVRELREAVRYMPSRGRFKLYIIDEVHQLTSEAFNALLKTLEEPPPHVKFIFATTEPQKIPVTILSRCQRFDFRRVSVPVLAEHVKTILAAEGAELGATALAAIVREAQGSVRDALSLLDQVLSYAGDEPDDGKVIEALGIVDRQAVIDLVDRVLDRDANRMLEIVAEIDARGHDLADLASLVVEHYRDLMVAKVVEQPSASLLDRSPGEVASLRAQGEKLSQPDLHRCFSIMVGVADDVSRSILPRVTLEMGLLRLFEVEPVQSLSTLLDRLDSMVAEGGSGEVSARAPVASKKVQSETATMADEAVVAPPGGGWSELVERVRRQRPALASLLEHGRPLKFCADAVEIGYPKDTFYFESAQERDNRSLLERVIAEHFGKPVTLTVAATEAADGGVQTLAESATDRQRRREREVRDGALEHPAVRGALAVLGGEVKEVIPLGNQADESAS
jgi:DNA polymerase-3 subunit gamma/tau